MDKVSFAGEMYLTSSWRLLADKVCFLGLEILHFSSKKIVNKTLSVRKRTHDDDPNIKELVTSKARYTWNSVYQQLLP